METDDFKAVIIVLCVVIAALVIWLLITINSNAENGGELRAIKAQLAEMKEASHAQATP